MEYTTYKHPKYNFYIQKNKNGQPVVIYYFTSNQQEINKITVIDNMPQYFVLPNLPVRQKNCIFDADYTLNCKCLDELYTNNLPITFICTGNTIKMTGGNVPISLVLATNQSLHAITEKHSYNEPFSYLLIAPTQEKKSALKTGNFWYNKKYFCTRINYGFKSLPQNTFSSTLKINQNFVFNLQAKEIEEKPNNQHNSIKFQYNEDNENFQ